jgi:hypothetical protein
MFYLIFSQYGPMAGTKSVIFNVLCFAVLEIAADHDYLASGSDFFPFIKQVSVFSQGYKVLLEERGSA